MTVVIIGAGIAGLKAAIELTRNGVDCVILEARDRLGGRLHTVKTPKTGIPLDLGASWFHDCLINPVLQKTVEKGNVTFYYDDGKSAVYTKDGLVDPNRKLEPVADEIDAYLGEICSRRYTPRSDVSVREACYDYLKRKGYTLTEDQIKYAPQLARFSELWIGSSWEQLSARCICEDQHYGRNAMVTNGYFTFYEDELAELVELSGVSSAKDLIGTKILLEEVVSKVEYDYLKNEVIVYTTDSSRKPLHCSHLLCSAPLSVLKLTDPTQEGCITWQPALPAPIRSSLDRVSFSALGKFFFEFKSCFWPEDTDRFLCIAEPDQELTTAAQNGIPMTFSRARLEPEHAIPTGANGLPDIHQFTVLFMNLQRAAGKPILLALTSNPLTHWLESATDKQIWTVMEPLIKTISNKKRLGFFHKPVSITHTSWTNDPFARGSYTGVTIGDDLDAALEAFENVPVYNGRVRFIGEGVVAEGNGCAHAAWTTGKTEAAKVVEMLNKPKL